MQSKEILKKIKLVAEGFDNDVFVILHVKDKDIYIVKAESGKKYIAVDEGDDELEQGQSKIERGKTITQTHANYIG